MWTFLGFSQSHLEWNLLSLPVMQKTEETHARYEHSYNGHHSLGSSKQSPEKYKYFGSDGKISLVVFDLFHVKDHASLEAP